MNNTTKMGLFAGMGALAILALNTSRLARFAKEFQLVISGRVHSITATVLTLAIDITFKNPTDARLTIKHPTVYIYDQDPAKTPGITPIVTSTVESKTYQIAPNGETKLDPVYVKLSFLDFTFLSSAWTLLQRLLKKEPASLWVRALTQVNGSVPVTQSQVIVLNAKK